MVVSIRWHDLSQVLPPVALAVIGDDVVGNEDGTHDALGSATKLPEDTEDKPPAIDMEDGAVLVLVLAPDVSTW